MGADCGHWNLGMGHSQSQRGFDEEWRRARTHSANSHRTERDQILGACTLYAGLRRPDTWGHACSGSRQPAPKDVIKGRSKTNQTATTSVAAVVLTGA